MRSLIYGSGFVLLWVWVGRSIRPLDSRLPFTVSTALKPAGVVFGVLGVLVVAWCVGVFVARGKGTPAPFDAPRVFVASGPYRYVRNPMYIGAMMIILGAGLLLMSLSIVILTGLFWLCAHLFVWLYEEPVLTKRFGEDYCRYEATVRRWVPRFLRVKRACSD